MDSQEWYMRIWVCETQSVVLVLLDTLAEVGTCEVQLVVAVGNHILATDLSWIIIKVC